MPESKGWIIKRPITGTGFYDGMGCYPIFSCENWKGLENDLEWVGDQVVALSMVTDPFGNYNQASLLKCFKDTARPYKKHFIVDLHKKIRDTVSEHHIYYSRKAFKEVKVEVCEEPIKYLDEWVSLYDHLINRHNIRGLSKFSREAFAIQLNTPGIVAFRAVHENQTVGMLLWYVHGKIGYSHLGAYNPEGYQLGASYAVYWTPIEYFADHGLKWLDLGAGAGTWGDENDGLSQFKRGWASDTRTAFFCGRIFDNFAYQNIVRTKNIGKTEYFPAYRAGEVF